MGDCCFFFRHQQFRSSHCYDIVTVRRQQSRIIVFGRRLSPLPQLFDDNFFLFLRISFHSATHDDGTHELANKRENRDRNVRLFFYFPSDLISIISLSQSSSVFSRRRQRWREGKKSQQDKLIDWHKRRPTRWKKFFSFLLLPLTSHPFVAAFWSLVFDLAISSFPP